MASAEDLAGLLARVGLRDRAAFAALYQAASPKLFAICLRILKNRSEAEDALQDVFVKIWNGASGYGVTGVGAQAWMNTVARNHAIDLLRARKPGGGDLEAAEQLAAQEPTPEDVAVNASEGRRIDACMSALPPPRGEAVRRAYVEGDSYIELSERFSVPLNTMRSWLRRSLIQLRECMSHG